MKLYLGGLTAEYSIVEKGIFKPYYFRFYKTGIVYRGEWRNGAPQGNGKNYYPNGSYYDGTFEDGIPHGYGRFINNQGDYYEGDIKYGRANGHGLYENE